MSEQRIAYFLTLFPKVSETFVLNEVVGLQEQGLPILPVCFDSSRRLEPVRHAAAGRLRTPVVYLKDGFPWTHLRALGYWLPRTPLGLARLVFRNHEHPAPRGESKLGRLALALAAAKVVREQGVTHVHAHWSYPCDIALLIAPLAGVSMSFTAHAHDIFEDEPLYERDGYPFERRVRAATFVMACTAYNRDRLRSLVAPDLEDRLDFGYHGLSLEQFAPGDRDGSDVSTLVSVGRFVAYKGFDVIVHACERLHREGRQLRCVLVGPAGSQTPVVEQLVREADLEDVVELPGPQTQEQLVRLYGEADVYVNASNPDGEYGVANVIVEAMASGLPVIVSDRPQVAEYVEDGRNGLLVPYGDEAALAEAIARVLDDRALAERLGGAARATVEDRFDIGDTVERLRARLTGRRPAAGLVREAVKAR